jgi:DNA-directed RNA polymerase subunit omega
MAQRRNNTLMDPPIEDLLDKVDSKFTLVALSAKRARQINSYYNQLGEGLGMVVPPQVTSVSGKPLTIAFEEISARKATYHRIEPGEEDGTEGLAEVADADGILAVADVIADVDAAVDAAVDAVDEAVADMEVAAVEVTAAEVAADITPEADATELSADQ